MKKRGFTLLELLIVIGILSILTTVVAFVLNPAELLKQARDSQRLADLNSLQTALGLYVASVDSLNLGDCGITAGGRCTAAGTGGFSNTTCTVSTSTVVVGPSGTGGWVDVNLGSISSGSPLSKLPLDPKNDTTYFYGYECEETNYTFELNSRLESNKYRDLMKTDGGEDSACATYTGADCFYEIGTDPGLDL